MNPRIRLRVTALVAAIGAVLGVTGLTADWSSGLQHQAEDLLQPGTDRADDIVVVAIDRASLAAVGEAWPWSRERHAALLEEITAGDPAVVAYDVLFADVRSDDARLADALATGPVVLASALTLRATDGPPLIVEQVQPTEALGREAAGVGHANVSLTPDRGVVRSLPLYAVDDRGRITPSLALAAVATAEGADQFIERPNGVQFGSRFVPLDDARLRVNWADELDAPADTISAIDVLEGRVPRGSFSEKWVVVGVTEPTLGDLHLVPTDKSGSVAGVMVHANTLNTLHNEAYLEDVATGGQVVLIVILALGGALAFLWLRLRWAFVSAVVAAVLVIALTARRFHGDGELWNVVWPLAALVVVAGTGSAARYTAEIRHRRRASALFASYVRAGTLDQLADPAVLDRATAGERLPVSVLFCDLRGFTPIAAELTAEEVRRLLEIYYDYATEIIDRHTGTVMQFVGDEVFAVFGAPVAAGDDAERAVACARHLVGEVQELDRRLASADLPTIRFGIGVNRGEVVASHVGGSRHRQYTVIGDPVNVGSRLCGQADAGGVAVADAAIGTTTTDGFRRFDGLDLKGVEQPLGGWVIG